MNRCLRLLVFCCITSLLTACTFPIPLQRQTDGLHGPVLVWHNWEEPNAAILQGLFDDFMTIHPNVQIVNEYVDSDDFDEKFVQQMSIGLGPDLIIGLELSHLRELHELELLAKLSSTPFEEQGLLPHALDALRIGDHLYGVPFAAYTEILYYNKTLVEQPAKTFDELLQEARVGKQVALPMDFYHAYWGVRTLGDDLWDEGGNFQAESGLEEWVAWLLEAQKENIILSADYAELKRLFAEGHAAYLVGNSIALAEFRQVLGDDVVGVTMLPYRAVEGEELDSVKDQISSRLGGAGGFLHLEVMAISNMSAQKQLSFNLIEFFTNRTHQRELAQYDLGQIPINLNVRFDPRFSPTQAMLIRQSVDTAIVSLQNVDLANILNDAGTDLYSQILEGVLLPEESNQFLQENITSQLQ